MELVSNSIFLTDTVGVLDKEKNLIASSKVPLALSEYTLELILSPFAADESSFTAAGIFSHPLHIA